MQNLVQGPRAGSGRGSGNGVGQLTASTGCLSYAQLLSCSQASIFFLSEQGVSEIESYVSEIEVTMIAACCQVLASTIFTPISSNITQKQLLSLTSLSISDTPCSLKKNIDA